MIGSSVSSYLGFRPLSRNILLLMVCSGDRRASKHNTQKRKIKIKKSVSVYPGEKKEKYWVYQEKIKRRKRGPGIMFTTKHFWHNYQPSHPAKIWAIVKIQNPNFPTSSHLPNTPKPPKTISFPLTWLTRPNKPYLGTWYSKPSLKSDSRRDVVLWY